MVLQVDRFFRAVHDRSLRCQFATLKASNSERRGALALAALIHGFGGADTIAFSAQFAFWGGRAGALLAGTRLGFCQFLAAAGKAGFPDVDAGATGAFGATLAAVGFAIVGVAFARPLVLLHSATGTRRRRNRFPQTSAAFFLRFHNDANIGGPLSHYIVSPRHNGCRGDPIDGARCRPARIATRSVAGGVRTTERFGYRSRRRLI